MMVTSLINPLISSQRKRWRRRKMPCTQIRLARRTREKTMGVTTTVRVFPLIRLLIVLLIVLRVLPRVIAPVELALRPLFFV